MTHPDIHPETHPETRRDTRSQTADLVTGTAVRAPGLGRAIALAVLGAAAAAAAVHLLFDALGADFVVAPSGQDPTTVSAGIPAGIAAVVTALGGLFAFALTRLTLRPSRAFLVAAGLVLAVVAVNPVLAADQALTVVALELEHVAVAAVALLLLLPPLRAHDRARDDA